MLSLDVLTALAEEADALQTIRRKAIMPIFVHASHSVFAILGKLIAGCDPCAPFSCCVLLQEEAFCASLEKMHIPKNMMQKGGRISQEMQRQVPRMGSALQHCAVPRCGLPLI